MSKARRLGRVLIVDDSWDAREMYALYLKTVGYDATTAHDGPTAIEAAERSKPDVIVMDLSMPGLDGIEATQRLKSRRSTERISVILLTGHHHLAVERGALERGVDVFLTKPCLPEDLEQHIAKLITLKRSR